MSILKRLFGGGGDGAAPTADAQTYKDFTIFPEPISEGGQYRISARIEKEVDGDLKVHKLIRADTLGDHGAAAEASLGKARQMIDEQGERLFDG